MIRTENPLVKVQETQHPKNVNECRAFLKPKDTTNFRSYLIKQKRFQRGFKNDLSDDKHSNSKGRPNHFKVFN